MKVLFILNDPPYGTERSYNALRLANALVKNDSTTEVTIFLLADAVAGSKKGQKTPDGYYNLERMLKRFAVGTHKLLVCGTCMDARGITEAELIDGVRRSTMDELAAATLHADRVLVF
ncbi:MAG: DsrE/DsrF/TusD sulfur relay family protein [Nitrospiraceae bacterium]